MLTLFPRVGLLQCDDRKRGRRGAAPNVVSFLAADSFEHEHATEILPLWPLLAILLFIRVKALHDVFLTPPIVTTFHRTSNATTKGVNQSKWMSSNETQKRSFCFDSINIHQIWKRKSLQYVSSLG